MSTLKWNLGEKVDRLDRTSTSRGDYIELRTETGDPDLPCIFKSVWAFASRRMIVYLES